MRKYKLTVPGPLPGLNEYIDAERGNRYAAAGMKVNIQSVLSLNIRRQLPGLHIENPVVMHYSWFEPHKRRDRDNISFARKFIQDALTGCGVLKNDGWKEILWFTDAWFVDKRRPRVEILMIEVEKSGKNGQNPNAGAGKARPY